MTKQQPEALWLANEFKLCNEYDSIPSITDIAKAEAELRRLHTRIAELEAQRDELLKALNEINSWLVCGCIATPEDMAQSFPHMQQVADAAITKAKGDTL